MQVEKQCCNLEQAKRLKELGVEQISYFVWGEKRKALMESWTVDGIEDTFYSAYTVAELGEVLPEQITKYFDFKGYIVPETGEYVMLFNSWFFTVDEKRKYGCRYDFNGSINISTENFYGTEAESRAGLLIHLIENNLITVEEINNRLQNA